jgi:lantibiotic leader peptide-processing serine protease
MNRALTLTGIKPRLCAGLAALACAPAAAQQAQRFLLYANQWGAAQEQGVLAAGGTVDWRHRSGMALVRSAAPDFAARVLAGGTVKDALPDLTLQAAAPRVFDDADAASVGADAGPSEDLFNHVQWAPQAVRAPQAWSAGYTGAGVRVAIIDGGVFADHPDLTANVDRASARSFVPGAEGSCEQRWDCDAGTFWHGTHVAGIVGAPINGRGIVGIAPQATLVPVKALHGGSGGIINILQAIVYATDEGRANVINLSLGGAVLRGGGGAAARQASQIQSYFNRAINYASSQGVLVVSSAGNEGTDLDHAKSLIQIPTESGNGLAVSATGPEGHALGATDYARFARYSNHGAAITVAAPGGNSSLPGNAPCTLARAGGGALTRPCWAFDMVISTSRGPLTGAGVWAWAEGTSMAAPVVSGIAALIKQKHPGISTGDWKNSVRRAVIDAGKPGADPYYGSGFVDAASAVAP